MKTGLKSALHKIRKSLSFQKERNKSQNSKRLRRSRNSLTNTDPTDKTWKILLTSPEQGAPKKRRACPE
ncbi:hypothetical protein A0128_06280 [Leptospira tipperaryensis]|uniref:Uncharacterized protein n=1 Tax=Leptospira tipperaryensis TaxID=2564040 RepID=A0A1D7UVA1_9LEPT|nr:hypothetical protein A0128_06280 [Leptospira tipperaryensis]